jgi:hypothetical protein
MPKDIIPSTRGLDIELQAGNTAIEISTPPEPTKPEPVAAKPVPSPEPAWKEGDAIVIAKVIDSGPGWLSVFDTKGNKFKFSGGTISWRNNNPGNIVYGSFAAENGAVNRDYKHFSVFPTYEDGQKAQKKLLFATDSVYYKLSIVDAIRRYAPADDGNNPKEYANFVSKKIGIDRTTPLYKLTDAQQDAMIAAMQQLEGFKQGKIEKQ